MLGFFQFWAETWVNQCAGQTQLASGRWPEQATLLTDVVQQYVVG